MSSHAGLSDSIECLGYSELGKYDYFIIVDEKTVSSTGRQSMRDLFKHKNSLSTISLILVNLVPIAGVFFFGLGYRLDCPSLLG